MNLITLGALSAQDTASTAFDIAFTEPSTVEVLITGTFGGGTVSLQQRIVKDANPANDVWMTLGTATAAARITATLYHNGSLRLSIGTATTPAITGRIALAGARIATVATAS
jgi:G:T/U-mismatch repair DNA glycosylase